MSAANSAGSVRGRIGVGARSTLFVGLVILSVTACSRPVEAQSESTRKKVIDRSIVRAQRYLLRSLRLPNSGVFQSNYPLGYRALAAYALLDSGVSARDRRVAAILDDMDQRPFVKVYSVALYVLALDAALRNSEISQKATSGRTTVRSKAGTDRWRSRLSEAVEWLIAARFPGEGTWGYGSYQSEIERGWQDFSNTQFAVLALQVGMNHGVAIPTEVFEEISQTLIEESWPAGPVRALTVTGRGWWSRLPVVSRAARTRVSIPPVRETSGGLVLQAAPLGWGYRPGRRRDGSFGQFSMVAAASSSLMVARAGLERSQALSFEVERKIDTTIVGGLLALEADWSALVPTSADTIHRNYFYTLYSMEKALDLGGIQRLGAIDWYREHSVFLVKKQGADGSWGASRVGREFVEVSTCFAILFLRRATRFLRVQKIERLATGPQAGEIGVTQGKVFLPSLDGVIELAMFFRSLSELRTPEYLKLAREVVQVARPQEEQELIPWLLSVRSAKRDAVDRFARDEIERLTGLPGKSPDDVVLAWVAAWRQAAAWGTTGGPEAAEGLDYRLRNGELTDPMQLAVIGAVVRRGGLRFVEGLILRIRDGSAAVSERAHLGLVGITGRPYVKVAFAKPTDRADAAQGWSEYWATEGTRIERDLRWRSLRKSLEDAESAGDRRRARAAIVALGVEVLPRIDRILERDRFAFDWVVIRRRLVEGPPKGLSPR